MACMEHMLTEQDVASILGHSISTTRRARCAGEYPVHVKLPNGRILVSQRALRAWLASLELPQ